MNDTERAGDFSPLRFMPKDKVIVLGIASTRTLRLEKTTLGRRTEYATEYVPLERLAASPQYGFASTVGGNPLLIEDERQSFAWSSRLRAKYGVKSCRGSPPRSKIRILG